MADSDYGSDVEEPDEGDFVQTHAEALGEDPFFAPVELPVAPDEDEELDDVFDEDEDAGGPDGTPTDLVPERPTGSSRWRRITRCTYLAPGKSAQAPPTTTTTDRRLPLINGSRLRGPGHSQNAGSYGKQADAYR